MSTKTDRLADTIIAVSSPIILEHIREHGESFGIASVSGVTVSTDYSYADIHVTSTANEELLPKFLSPIADEIRRAVAKAISLYKTPKIRFRAQKTKANTTDIYSLINEISTQYGLHSND